MPGVTPGQSGENLSGASTFNPRGASNFNALGQQANTNGWLVDGIDNNEYTFNTVIVTPSVESVREFKVLNGVFSAEFGRGAGVVSVSTKSGSNQWHGSAYEYLRNDALDAADYFYKANPSPQFRTSSGKAKTPPFKQNLFGGTIGGRIARDRHFFFGSYEGFLQKRLNQTASEVVVPNADLLSQVPGDLGRFFRTVYIDRGVIPASPSRCPGAAARSKRPAVPAARCRGCSSTPRRCRCSRRGRSRWAGTT